MNCRVKNPSLQVGKLLMFELVGTPPEIQCEPGEVLELEIKRPREKRSLDANAYCWVLIGKLAEKMGLSSLEIYRDAIRELHIYKDVALEPEAAATMRHIWQAHGLGWQTEQIDYAPNGMVLVRFWYGSSSYNTRQMSRLIDNLVQDCKAVGIETMTPQELEALIGRWGSEKQKG